MDKYLTSQIITYMGNKRKLLPYIEAVLDEIKKESGKKSLKVGDGFSGSGVVSRLLKTKASVLHTNDIAGYSKTLNECYLSVPSKSEKIKIKNHIDEANQKAEIPVQEKWISKHPNFQVCNQIDNKLLISCSPKGYIKRNF